MSSLPKKECFVEGCNSPVHAKGLCAKHRRRQTRGQSLTTQTAYDKSEEQRFWEKVDTSGECWLWVAQTDDSGYGHFRNTLTNSCLAHRYSYRLHHGALPDEADVLHECDTPGCVRPSHLFEGTHDDNMRDMAVKGRMNGSHGIKLTAVTVREIRRLQEQGVTYQALADGFGVALTTISHVIKRRTWKHID